MAQTRFTCGQPSQRDCPHLSHFNKGHAYLRDDSWPYPLSLTAAFVDALRRGWAGVGMRASLHLRVCRVMEQCRHTQACCLVDSGGSEHLKSATEVTTRIQQIGNEPDSALRRQSGYRLHVLREPASLILQRTVTRKSFASLSYLDLSICLIWIC